ncbi:HPP family protein [Cohnella faecalis]|uniref:HPP family protein n=1 Tax=Cohnella faecalis TaxID=2315694 RepID=A0A398CPH6_9BACL|nr:HPP family protein [Cohnella faecalis]RIE01391.1 hypothetical protein D3H35_23775 [Cohnella faecalis]
MNYKFVLIGLYIVFIYWLSSQEPALHALFYPTLGAFCFLFASRTFDARDVGRILIGATISSIIGSWLHQLYPSAISLFANVLIVAWLIKRFHWNAPPILAVSIVPFFVPQTNVWLIPASVSLSLLGLILVLACAHLIESKWREAPTLRRPIATEAE